MRKRFQDFREQFAQSSVPKSNPITQSMETLRTTTKKAFHVKALFEYEPTKDSGLPSRGLQFTFGDILDVMNASDDEWWQARKAIIPDGEDDPGIGIIPSKQRVEKRERVRMKRVNFNANDAFSNDHRRFHTMTGLNENSRKKNFSFSRRFPFMKSRESSDEIGKSGSDNDLNDLRSPSKDRTLSSV